MTAPNIVNTTTMTLKTEAFSLVNVSPTVAVNNAAASGLVKKVVSLTVSNINGANDSAITVTINDQDDGAGTAVSLATTIVVPANSTLIVIDANAPIFLQEDQSIVATASTNGDLDVVVSYQEIA